MTTLLLRAAILGLMVSSVTAGFNHPATAQSQTFSREGLIRQAKQTVADYKKLCKKLDDSNAKIKEIEDDLDTVDVQLSGSLNTTDKLNDAQVDEYFESIEAGLVVNFDAPSFRFSKAEAASALKRSKKLAADYNRAQSMFDEWLAYGKKLETKLANAKEMGSKAAKEKEKLEKNASRLLELLKDLPENPGIIAKDPEEKKLIEDLDWDIQEGVKGLNPHVDFIFLSVQDLEGDKKAGDGLLQPEEANQLLQEVNVSAAQEFARRLTNNMKQLSRDASILEADIEKIGQKPLSGGNRNRVAVARALPENPTPILLDEPTSNLDEPASNDDSVLGPVHNFVPFITFSGGLNTLVDNAIDLPDFNQFIETESRSYAAIEIGVDKRISDRFIFNASFLFSRLDLGLDNLGNNPPFVGSLPLGGNIESFSIAPLVGISWDILRNDELFMQPWIKAGGGLAFQKLKATNGGVNVLNEKETTAMATLRAGVDFPINDYASAGFGGYLSWFDGFDVAAGPGVTSRLEDRTEMGAFVQLKFSLGEGGQ